MRKYVLAAVLVLMASGAKAATLNVVGGQLMGASGVDVGAEATDGDFGRSTFRQSPFPPPCMPSSV